MSAEPSIRAEWLADQVREILLEADPSAFRAERAGELRGRVRAVVAHLRSATAERGDGAAGSTLHERARALLAAMEGSLPSESTRARWAAFVGEVHPAYEALLHALRTSVAPKPAVRPTNYARSLFHLASALVAAAAIALLPARGYLVAIAGAFALYAWSMEIGRRMSPRLNDSLMRAYGPIAHAHERYRVNSATWYATALVLLSLLATRTGMMAGVIVLGVADPIAALVGRRFGRHKLRTGRSLEGTLAFAASGTLASALVLALMGVSPASHALGIATVAGVAGALAELFATRVDDNFAIPLAVGATVTLVAPALG